MFLRNYSNTDEVYQYLEPAHRLVFGYGIVAWEFREGLRSWIIPGFIAGIIKAAATLSDDPKFYLGAVGACLSLLALPIVAIAYAWGRRFYGISGAIICGLLAATWPELVYFAPKVLSDVIATDALVLGVFLIYPAPEARDRGALVAAGFCPARFRAALPARAGLCAGRALRRPARMEDVLAAARARRGAADPRRRAARLDHLGPTLPVDVAQLL